MKASKVTAESVAYAMARMRAYGQRSSTVGEIADEIMSNAANIVDMDKTLEFLTRAIKAGFVEVNTRNSYGTPTHFYSLRDDRFHD